MAVFEVQEGVTPAQLLEAMRAHDRLSLGQWGIHVDEHGAWLTNPYGVDCTLVQVVDKDGASKLLDYIAAGDKIPHEWGHL